MASSKILRTRMFIVDTTNAGCYYIESLMGISSLETIVYLRIYPILLILGYIGNSLGILTLLLNAYKANKRENLIRTHSRNNLSFVEKFRQQTNSSMFIVGEASKKLNDYKINNSHKLSGKEPELNKSRYTEERENTSKNCKIKPIFTNPDSLPTEKRVTNSTNFPSTSRSGINNRIDSRDYSLRFEVSTLHKINIIYDLINVINVITLFYLEVLCNPDYRSLIKDTLF
ncbi:unnamed protein product [Gordionus sp. m RMFG-2023]